MNKNNIEILRRENFQDLSMDLKFEIHKRGIRENCKGLLISIAYVLYKTKEIEVTSYREFIEKTEIPNKIYEILDNYIPEYWDMIEKKKDKFSKENLLAFILFEQFPEMQKGEDCSTPSGVSKLVCRLLDVKDSEDVLELCSGSGNFAVELLGISNQVNYKGIEIVRENYDIAMLRISLLSENAVISNEDVFESEDDKLADKLFSNYPFMNRSFSMEDKKEKLCRFLKIDTKIVHRVSSDWIFNTLLVKQMKITGKAVAIMTNGSTWNMWDRIIREFFVNNQYIETIISLPVKIFDDCLLPTTMIVFSNNNQKINMIDAKNIYTQERRNCIFTDEDIEKILGLIGIESDISTVKTAEDIKKNEFILNAERYFEQVPKIKDGVEFNSIIKKVTRGSQLKAAEFDELKSLEQTPYQYLTLANINDGIVSFEEDGQYMSSMPEKLEKYCIKNNSIVFAKIGSPKFKSAVVQVEGNRKILANGNLFVIEIDEKKANPFFIESFFASKVGEEALKNIYTGAVMRTISIDRLKKMSVPLPDKSIQDQIATEYKKMLDKVQRLQNELSRATNKLKTIYQQ